MQKSIIVIPFSKVFANNEMFNSYSQYNNDNRLEPFIKLYNILTDLGHTITTYDLSHNIKSTDIYLSFNHQPKIFKRIGRKINLENRILIPMEPLCIENFQESTIHSYGKVLSWNEKIIDDKRVERIKAYPIIKLTLDWIPLKERKFLTNISMNKKSSYIGELYSERLKTILLAEQLFHFEFDHYGVGWNNPKNLLQKMGLKKYQYLSSFRGALKHKYETLKQYKFSICYENTRDLPGNISEKIFDCFQCGVIPLYWGAPDVLRYIPPETFIWRENFTSNKEMLLFIKSMSDFEIASMIDAIDKFIKSDKIEEFWDETYVAAIVKIIQSLSI
jgi:alpha(1,3/1,4) fucosyltransferase